MENKKGSRPGKTEILAAINKYHLMLAGYSAADILGFGNLGELTKDKMHELLHTKKALDEADVKTKLFREPDEKEK